MKLKRDKKNPPAVEQVGIWRGFSPNPNIVYGQLDETNDPLLVAKFATRLYDLQMNNGWQNTNYGARITENPANYLSAQFPTIPGQSRISGQNPADFFPVAMSPSQWDSYIASLPNQANEMVGGPGVILGRLDLNYRRGA